MSGLIEVVDMELFKTKNLIRLNYERRAEVCILLYFIKLQYRIYTIDSYNSTPPESDLRDLKEKREKECAKIRRKRCLKWTIIRAHRHGGRRALGRSNHSKSNHREVSTATVQVGTLFGRCHYE